MQNKIVEKNKYFFSVNIEQKQFDKYTSDLKVLKLLLTDSIYYELRPSNQFFMILRLRTYEKIYIKHFFFHSQTLYEYIL